MVTMLEVTIIIQNNGLRSLEMAATILHEGIHAEIYRYVDSYRKGVNPENRPNLLGYYFQYQAQNNNTLSTSNAQHQHMADNYVKPIANALRTLDNNRYSLDSYMPFAWDGLRKFGWDGYWDNGKYIKLDRDKYNECLKKKIMKNTQFGKDCK